MSAGAATLGGVERAVAGAARTGRTRAGELGLAAVATAGSVLGTVFEIVEAARPVPPLVLGVLIAAVTGAFLACRWSPVVTAVAVVAACLLYHVVGYPGLAPAVVLFVALYAVTADGTGARSLVIAGVLLVVASAVPLLPPQPTTFGLTTVAPAVAMVAVAAMGDAARSRRLAAAEQVRAVRSAAAQNAQRQLVEDRIDVAREVHDVLAHTITVIAVQAAAATEALDDRPEEARAALGAVRGAAREAMTELRSTLTLLRTGPIDPGAPQLGLPQLPQLQQRAEAAGVAVTLTVTGERPLPPAVERAIFRIVQEALTNTIRRAAASIAAVTVDLTGAEVTVEITDDGTAADQDRSGGGHGLAGMRERARALGGSLDAGPRPDGGFRVAARLPA